MSIKKNVLKPFGLELNFDNPGVLIDSVEPSEIQDWIQDHHLIILRGVVPGDDEQMLAFCQALGTPLEWEFGAINELELKPDAANYIYTNREVPFHWDGAFIGKIPHLVFFHCVNPGSGGETTFANGASILDSLDSTERELWQKLVITYRTEKVVHYGGEFSSPLIDRHPITGADILRYAEPVTDLNPVTLEVDGLSPEAQSDFVREMHQRLNSSNVCYEHTWKEGDIVIADNFSLLHGRREFTADHGRHLRRINILPI